MSLHSTHGSLICFGSESSKTPSESLSRAKNFRDEKREGGGEGKTPPPLLPFNTLGKLQSSQLPSGKEPFRATLSRKLTALICRLPLRTLIYWPEASHLGDLMRLWVRTGMGVKTPAQQGIFSIGKLRKVDRKEFLPRVKLPTVFKGPSGVPDV